MSAEEKKLNRQARLAEDFRPWNSYGNVTFEEAAMLFYDECEKPFKEYHGLVVQVRDDQEPDVVYTLKVESFTDYRVLGLRGGV